MGGSMGGDGNCKDMKFISRPERSLERKLSQFLYTSKTTVTGKTGC